MNTKAIAIIDTSFYIHLVKMGLIDIFINLYNVIVCNKGKSEITYFKYNNMYVPLDIEIFDKLVKDKRITIKNPKKISKKLKSEISKDSGELYSIALAQELDCIVFIDNGRPFEYCKKYDVKCANSIELMVYLNSKKLLTKEEITNKLRIIQNSIPIKYLEDCLNILNVVIL